MDANRSPPSLGTLAPPVAVGHGLPWSTSTYQRLTGHSQTFDGEPGAQVGMTTDLSWHTIILGGSIPGGNSSRRLRGQ